MTNNAVSECPIPVMDTNNLGNMCVPSAGSTKDAIDTLQKALGENENFSQFVIEIVEAKTPLIIMAVIVFITTVIYIYLLKFIAKPVLYISIFALFLFGLLAGGWVFMMKDNFTPIEGKMNNYQYCFIGAILIWITTALYTLFVCCEWKNIKLGAAILSCSSEYMSSNNRIILVPIITYIALIPITAIWVYSSVYLMSIGTPSYEPNSFIAKITLETHVHFLFWAYLFGFFWLIAFILAVEQFVIGATCCMWYYNSGGDESSQGGRVNLCLGFGWSIKSAGSLAMGSFIIAIVTMIRVVFEYLGKKFDKFVEPGGAINKCAMCCIRCVLWSLDTYVKFINKNAYIQIAL